MTVSTVKTSAVTVSFRDGKRIEKGGQEADPASEPARVAFTEGARVDLNEKGKRGRRKRAEA